MSIPGGNGGRAPHLDLDRLVHHTHLPKTTLSVALDAFVRRIGEAVSWVWVLLLAVIILNVVMRYVFGEGRIELEELQWHLFSTGFLICLSYCFEADDHVRVDILHDRMNVRTQAWVEFVGILFFLLPFVAIVLIYSPQFIHYSFSIGEVSDAPGGLAFRWIIKSVLFVSFVLLTIAGLSRLTRVGALLFGVPRPIATEDPE